jgi:cation diffusion facilitator CzcD-associated flavoprotein CzcO
MVNPDMCTNQSRHTVSFSDLAWPSTAPIFPKAWQVGQYLERYVKTYPGYEIQKNCQVKQTEYLGGRWKVKVLEKLSQDEKTIEFDHMIVTSGFFGSPKIPPVLEGSGIPVWHSSKFRNLDSLTLNAGKSVKPGAIVVVGGQMSGVEVAASLALQLSSRINTPGTSNTTEHTITHIIQQPSWVMPLFFPNKPQTLDKVSETSLSPLLHQI